MNDTPVQECKLLKAAREFIRKCDSGEARSVKSYADFKEGIAELEAAQFSMQQGEESKNEKNKP